MSAQKKKRKKNSEHPGSCRLVRVLDRGLKVYGQCACALYLCFTCYETTYTERQNVVVTQHTQQQQVVSELVRNHKHGTSADSNDLIYTYATPEQTVCARDLRARPPPPPPDPLGGVVGPGRGRTARGARRESRRKDRAAYTIICMHMSAHLYILPLPVWSALTAGARVFRGGTLPERRFLVLGCGSGLICITSLER